MSATPADAVATAGAVRSGASRAAEELAAARARIDAADGALNCVVTDFRNRADADAARIDRSVAAGEEPGPLAGATYGVKDLYDVAGEVTRAGSAVWRDRAPAAADAAAVSRLAAAGAMLVAGFNMDEFAFGFTTENAHYGTTRNPHDPTRVVGGSSGGSAAAVAAGMVPFSLGSDTNGSIRVPAALCGVYGLKPTYGRISRAGVAPLAQSFDHVGWFARSVRDVAAVYDVLHGPDPDDPACAEVPPEPVSGSLGAGSDGLRIAVAGGYFAEGALPDSLAAVAAVADALSATDVLEIPDAARAYAASLLITAAEGASYHLETIRTRAAELDSHTRDRWVAATMIPSVWYQNAQRFRRRYRDGIDAAMASCDVLIAPCTPFPAPEIGQDRITIDGTEVMTRPSLGRFTAPVSFVGYPALSVPVHAPGTLPLGVQLIARPFGDVALLRVAAALEKAGVCGVHLPTQFD